MKSNEYCFLRNVIGNYLQKLGDLDSNVLMVNADLMGTCRNKDFALKYPERSFNVGIAEQNMVSFSAGLAREGFIPYAFSMAPFISMRACEQCRTDVAYANLNVRLIGTYAGCSGGISGATHWAIEDCAIMTAMPNMVVLEPCDEIQAEQMMLYSLQHKGPIYMRSTVEPVKNIYDNNYKFELGKASIVRDGQDGVFICSGVTVQFALAASGYIFRNYNKSIRVIDMCSIKPIDKQAIIDAAATGRIVVAQDHNIIGGLGSLVASVLVEEKVQVDFVNLGISDSFVPMAHAPFLYDYFGYGKKGLIKAMVSLF